MLGPSVTKAPQLLAVSDNESTPPIGNECNAEQILKLNPTTTHSSISKDSENPDPEAIGAQAHAKLRVGCREGPIERRRREQVDDHGRSHRRVLG